MSKSRLMTLPRILEQIKGDRIASAKSRAGQNRFNHYRFFVEMVSKTKDKQKYRKNSDYACFHSIFNWHFYSFSH